MLSVSALDLFASSLGVFMLLAVMLFPYYLKKPALDRDIATATAALTSATRSRDAAALAEAQAKQRIADADAALAAAKARQETATAAAAEAAASRARRDAEAAAATLATPVPAPTPALPAPAPPPANATKPGIAIGPLDLVLVMDTTGSMGDELAEVQASLLGTLKVLARLTGSLRVGFVAYKDQGRPMLPGSFRCDLPPATRRRKSSASSAAFRLAVAATTRKRWMKPSPQRLPCPGAATRRDGSS